MACNRCGKCQDLSKDLSGPSSQQQRSMELSCAECHQPWRLEIHARLVHASSNVIARVRATGCAPIDLLPSLMAGQCASCSSVAAFRWGPDAWLSKSSEDQCQPLYTCSCIRQCVLDRYDSSEPLALPRTRALCAPSSGNTILIIVNCTITVRQRHPDHCEWV